MKTCMTLYFRFDAALLHLNIVIGICVTGNEITSI